MNYDQYGRSVATENDLIDELHRDPDIDISLFYVSDHDLSRYAKSLERYYLADWSRPRLYQPLDVSVDEFDRLCQQTWYMPKEYQDLDIAKWLLELCDTDAKLQRVGQEILLYQERDLMPLLKMLKYMVDILRKNNIVWGVGRGSSVSSYVLYLIGVHHIDSMYYDLDIGEFLRNK